jgi:A/G-specific adenine glycosylase
MKSPFSSCEKIRTPLQKWYSREKRDLPWRRVRDPYKIWVSEIMLQQTQVVTVIPYYNRWLKIFPSLAALARAPLSKALKSWAGLGYYRRVRLFHQAAQCVQREFRGKIPQTAEALRKLPGIGRYTAGAIASIAFNEKTPVLDGNVIRILTRIFAIPQSIDQQKTLEKLWSLAGALLPDKNPGDFNQALMELGATVCFPLTPQCARCPVKRECRAHQKGRELFYPVRSRKEAYEKIRMAALVLFNERNEVWLEKQPEQSRWGGLWMFPFWSRTADMLREIRPLGLNPVLFLKIQHGFTKYRITLEVYGSKLEKTRLLNRPHGRWLPVSRLSEVAFPSPHRKIALALEKNRSRALFPRKSSRARNGKSF